MCSHRTRLLTCTSNEFSWWPLTVHTDSKRDYWALMGNTAFCLQDQNDNCKWFCIALFDCYCVNDFFLNYCQWDIAQWNGELKM